VPTASLRAPTTGLDGLATSLGAPQITVELFGKNNIFCGNAPGVPGNRSYYLSFNNFYELMYSVCILIYVFMYLYSYPSTHSISGLAAGSA